MTKILNWLWEGLRKLLPVWIFFFLSFGLLALTRDAIFGNYHIKAEQSPEYVVGSLIMAKVVLLVDAFLKTRWLRGRPLIYMTIWNTGLYFVAALVVHHLEQVLTLVRRQHTGFAQANGQVFQEMREPRFHLIMVWVIALTFTFCMTRELIRYIGKERFWQVFFGRRVGSQRPGADDIRRVHRRDF